MPCAVALRFRVYRAPTVLPLAMGGRDRTTASCRSGGSLLFLTGYPSTTVVPASACSPVRFVITADCAPFASASSAARTFGIIPSRITPASISSFTSSAVRRGATSSPTFTPGTLQPNTARLSPTAPLHARHVRAEHRAPRADRPGNRPGGVVGVDVVAPTRPGGDRRDDRHDALSAQLAQHVGAHLHDPPDEAHVLRRTGFRPAL